MLVLGGLAASLGLESAYLHVGLPLSQVIKSLHQVEARLHRLIFIPLLYHNLRSCPIFRSFYDQHGDRALGYQAYCQHRNYELFRYVRSSNQHDELTYGRASSETPSVRSQCLLASFALPQQSPHPTTARLCSIMDM